MDSTLKKKNKDATQPSIEANRGIDVMEGVFGEIPIDIVPESLSERALKKRKEAEEKFGPNIPTGGELLSSFRPSKESTFKTGTENFTNLENDNSESSVDNKNTIQNIKEQSSSFSGVTISEPKSLQSTDYNPTSYLMPRYPMTYPERGCFVIFCQENFDLYNQQVENKVPPLPMQTPSKDAKKIELMARDLGFEHVRIFIDATKDDIQVWITKLSNADHSMYDCFGCAVITTGDDGDTLYVRDGTMKPDDFTKPFDADRCPSLAGKPKLFFFDSLRGFKMDHGSIVHLKQDRSSSVNQVLISKSLIDQNSTLSLRSSSSSQNGGEKFASKSSALMQNQVLSSFDYFNVKDGRSLSFEISNEVERSLPSKADFFIAYSTCPGYYSWRSTVNGSHFVRILCSVFAARADSMELMQLITLVNNMIAYDFKTSSSDALWGNKKQMSSITSTLTGEVYFAPKVSI